MSIGHTSVSEPTRELGSCEFLTRTRRTERCRELAERGYIVARVTAAPPDGTLRQAVDGAVEISLALRGALPPAVDIGAPVAAAAHDQLFRMRALGAQGLCVVLPELSNLADDGVLHGDDSETLDAWRELCTDAPVVLLFDSADCELNMLAPQSIARVFSDLVPDGTVHLSWAEDQRALEPDAPARPFDTSCASGSSQDIDIDAPLEKKAPDVDNERVGDDDDDPRLSLETIAATWTPEPTSVAGHDSQKSHQAWHRAKASSDGAAQPARVMRKDPLEGLEAIGADSPQREPLGSLFDAALHEPLTAPPPPRKPPMPRDQARAYAAELEEASGPRPVKAIEDLFRERYAPLLEAIARGLEDREAHHAVERWRSSFSRSYHDGFTALRVTGKRPTMVLDVPEVATRIGRLNGARAVQLLLVDGMRFDLGQRVHAQLCERMGELAVCVEETLLWSALPSVTPTQLRLLASGARGLRDPGPDSDREPVVQRGKSVTTLRRVRIGQRDLVKLDVVEARLREAGPGFDERMSAIADEVSGVVVRFAESLSPRTLLFVFGDHGFAMDADGPDTTGPARQGGASPEEVLVGGQAWLVGDVH